MKDNLKVILAYILTWAITTIGVLSVISYVYSDHSQISMYALIWVLGAMVVFHPTFDYWLKVSKRFLNIKP